ncbi:MAG: hypothetical protein JWN86_2912 [Planctomycetota bacterium]|nr:hypothetical protein [Planctomycetota bacterium]
MADANRCPNCGADLASNAADGLCPRCLLGQAAAGGSSIPVDGSATTGPAAPGSRRPPESTEGNSYETKAFVSRPAGDTVSPPVDAGEWPHTTDNATGTADGPAGSRDLPRGTAIRYFGDYELQKELGRGGMGVVYKALQVSLNRPVALKMIKSGMLADDAQLQRFQNEAEAVALLDHAGIVPVYEVGEHEGQRYFSMKLVEGGNLAEQLAAMKDNPRAAATLLAETAEAVHHAHMRGILHRDLKPANILVDAEGHPHVTDFGLAKRVEGDVEMTQSGAILGTPSYMSPEQATGRRGSITTATDVYGLGAILYALLTGRAPFGGDSVIETLDAVRTRAPEPPTKLNHSTPYDLNTICLKCLEKDPRRRYASAHELAVDLNHWLNSRPITARRVGAVERGWLWCKRRPAVAMLTGAVLLAIIAGTTAVFAVQSRANAKLKSSNTALEKERGRVEIRERQAVDAIRRFGDAIADEPVLKNSPALNDLRRRLLGEPISFFRNLRDQLLADTGTRPESLASLSAAVYQHAYLSQAVGDRVDAHKSFTVGLAVLERLVREHPSEPKFKSKLAASHYGMGFVQSSIGQARDARESIERASAIYADLLRQVPGDPDARQGLARCHLMLGMLEYRAGYPAPALDWLGKARDGLKQLLPLSREPSGLRAELVMCHINIGGVEEVVGRFSDALSDYREALRIADRLVLDHRTVAAYQLDQARIHGNIGKILGITGKPAEAEAALQKSRKIYESLVAEYPSTIDHQSGLASCYLTLAQIAAVTGRPSDSESSLGKAKAIFERLAAEHPESPDFASELGATLHNLGEMQLDLRKFTQARELLLQALTWQRKALAASPGNPRYRQCINAHLTGLIQAATAIGDKEAAEEARAEMVRIDASDPRKAALDERLTSIAKGAKPKDDAERLALALRAFEIKRFATAARLWAEALDADPRLANDRRAGHRYNSACAAVLAAAGQGKDDPPPDDTAKARLRRQALDWLRAEWVAWDRVAMMTAPGAKEAVAKALSHWKEDTDLAGIRGEQELARLPLDERKEWLSLWADVEVLLKRTQDDKR